MLPFPTLSPGRRTGSSPNPGNDQLRLGGMEHSSGKAREEGSDGLGAGARGRAIIHRQGGAAMAGRAKPPSTLLPAAAESREQGTALPTAPPVPWPLGPFLRDAVWSPNPRVG